MLHGKVVPKLGTSGGGVHFVEFDEIELMGNNILGLLSVIYTALLT